MRTIWPMYKDNYRRTPFPGAWVPLGSLAVAVATFGAACSDGEVPNGRTENEGGSEQRNGGAGSGGSNGKVDEGTFAGVGGSGAGPSPAVVESGGSPGAGGNASGGMPIVAGASGEGGAVTDVEPPQIVSINRESIAPGGVVEITATFSDRASVAGALVGETQIDATDSTNFAWPSAAIATAAGTLAIRVPDDVAPGVIALRLLGSTGPGEAIDLRVIEPPAGLAPAPTLGAFFVPSRLASEDPDDDPFPIPDFNPRPLLSSPEANAEWTYEITLNDGDYVCRSSGTVTGFERHEAIAGSFDYDAEHPLTGSYDLESDRVQVTIERSSSGGSAETYVGGWTGPSVGELASADPEERTLAPLILTSGLTGRQIVIEHFMRPTSECDENTEP
jgi:hypothetical protein